MNEFPDSLREKMLAAGASPPNAPEAGSNGERESIARILCNGREPTRCALGQAEDLIAAGFTRRAQHDGERVADAERDAQYWRLHAAAKETEAHHADAITRLERERDEARAMLNLYANATDRAFQGRDAVLPDFVRLGGCKAEGIAKLAEAYRAIRTERDAAIARAEAAEAREADAIKHATLFRESMQQSDKRAAALAEALRKEINRCPCCRGKGVWETNCPYCSDSTFDHECVTETKLCDRCANARAALAGNGNGWIACSERMPEPGSWVLAWGLPGSPQVGGMLYDLNRKWQWAETGEILSDALRITHWRPLPAAPPSAGETNHE